MRSMTILAAVAVLLPASQGGAATVLQYQTAASTANATLAPSATGAGVTGQAMTAGPGLTANSGGTWNWNGWDVASTDATQAVAAGDLWSWGFTSTQAWDLTGFDIRLDRSNTGPENAVIEVSTNGGASFTEVLNTTVSSSGTTFLGVDMTAFAGVTAMQFRLAAFGSTNPVGTFDLEAVNSDYAFSLSGELAAPVPLPAGLPLLLAGLGGLAWLRRRATRA